MYNGMRVILHPRGQRYEEHSFVDRVRAITPKARDLFAMEM